MENRSVDRIGPSIAPLLHSPMLQGAVRPNVQCSIGPEREAPLSGPLTTAGPRRTRAILTGIFNSANR